MVGGRRGTVGVIDELKASYDEFLKDAESMVERAWHNAMSPIEVWKKRIQCVNNEHEFHWLYPFFLFLHRTYKNPFVANIPKLRQCVAKGHYFSKAQSTPDEHIFAYDCAEEYYRHPEMRENLDIEMRSILLASDERQIEDKRVFLFKEITQKQYRFSVKVATWKEIWNDIGHLFT